MVNNQKCYKISPLKYLSNRASLLEINFSKIYISFEHFELISFSQVIVCIIDFIYPPKKSSDGFVPSGKDRGDYERLAEDVKDDLVDEEGSESEEKSENDKTDKSNASSPNVRKRKARKAD